MRILTVSAEDFVPERWRLCGNHFEFLQPARLEAALYIIQPRYGLSQVQIFIPIFSPLPWGNSSP